MEGGKKVQIPLASPIDTKTSDMMATFDQPKFQHNRQQYQGHYLPSSLRFEHDGWAVGNDVYDFDIVQSNISSNPAGNTIYKQGISDKVIQLNIYDGSTNTCIGIIKYCTDRSHATNGVTYIKGTFNNKQYSFKYNSIAHEVTTVSAEHNADLEITYMPEKQDSATGLQTFEIVDSTSKIYGSAALENLTDVYCDDGVTFPFKSYANNVFRWGSDDEQVTITFNDSTKVLTYNGDVLSIKVNGNKINAERVSHYIDSRKTQGTTATSYTAGYNIGRHYAPLPYSEDTGGGDLPYDFTKAIIDSPDYLLFPGETFSFNMHYPEWHGYVCKLVDRRDQNIVNRLQTGSTTIRGITLNAYAKKNGDTFVPHNAPYCDVTAGIWHKHNRTAAATASHVNSGHSITVPVYIKLCSAFTDCGLYYYPEDHLYWPEDSVVDESGNHVYIFPSGETAPANQYGWAAGLYIKECSAQEHGTETIVDPHTGYTVGTVKHYSVDGVKPAVRKGLPDGPYDRNETVYTDADFTWVRFNVNIYSDYIENTQELTLNNDNIANYFDFEVVGSNGVVIPRSVLEEYGLCSYRINHEVTYLSTETVGRRFNVTLAGNTRTVAVVCSSSLKTIVDPIYVEKLADTLDAQFSANAAKIKYKPLEGDLTEYTTLHDLATHECVNNATTCVATYYTHTFLDAFRVKMTEYSESTTGISANVTLDNNYKPYANQWRHSMPSTGTFDSETNTLKFAIGSDSRGTKFYNIANPNDVKAEEYYCPGYIYNNDLRTDDTSGGLISVPCNFTQDQHDPDTSELVSLGKKNMRFYIKLGLVACDRVMSINDGLSNITDDHSNDTHAFMKQSVANKIYSLWKAVINDPNEYTSADKRSYKYSSSFYNKFNDLEILVTNTTELVRVNDPSGIAYRQKSSQNINYNMPTPVKYNIEGYDVTFSAVAKEGEVDATFELAVDLLYKYDLQYAIYSGVGRKFSTINSQKVYTIPLQGAYSLQLVPGTGMYYILNGTNVVHTDSLGVNGTTYSAFIDYRVSNILTFTGYGILDTDVRILNINNSSIEYDNNGTARTVNIAALEADNNSSMLYKYVDTTEKELVEHNIHKVNTASTTNPVFQFVKQQWDTNCTTENFWWIDEKTILTLTQESVIVKSKTNELDDWNGDIWANKTVIPRNRLLTADIVKYGCVSAYNGAEAYFYTIDGTLKISFYAASNLSTPVISVKPNVVHRSIGTKLNATNTQLNTYSTLVLSTLVSSAKYSGTHIGNFILFGIHYDNNFNQWALKINLATKTFTVVQGYGYVGVNGCLTGGEIPADYFDAGSGFKDTVKSLSTLKANVKECTSVNDLYKIDVGNCVVGTDSQQWYIRSTISNIVSHLVWSNNNWTAVNLPINNNLAQVYKSSSFAKSTLTDYMPLIESFMSLFPKGTGALGAIFSTIIGVAGNPHLYYLAPKINCVTELQQTLGQYAYVHMNSTNTPEPESATDKAVAGDNSVNNQMETPVASDSNIFNVHTVTQKAGFSSNVFSSLLALNMSFQIGSNYFSDTETKVKSHQNQTATSEHGKKFEPFAVYNVDSLVQSDMTTKGIAPASTCSVTSMLSLGMFYSTSDAQKISAGPGWVNHNYVAQCVAQSITNHQTNIVQTGAMFLIGTLTMQEIKLKTEMTLLLARQAREASKLQGGNIYTIALGVSLAFIASAAEVAAVAQKVAQDEIPAILEGLGNKQLRTTVRVNKSAGTSDPEYTHRYGSKSECFMWPCFGINGALTYKNESVSAETQNKPWKMSLATWDTSSGTGTPAELETPAVNCVTNSNSSTVVTHFKGDVNYWIASAKGNTTDATLPSDMAFVAGVKSFLPETPFRNEDIGVSEPVFTTPPFQDYIIDKSWQLGHTASAGMTTWVSCKDTKLFDGEMSNAVISSSFCGVACPYTAIEIKRGVEKKYLRPWAITPNALALNISGFNCCYDRKAYHAFDGFGYRIVEWEGSPAMDEDHYTLQYSFLINDRFKRSNKLPPNEFLGNFKSDPTVAITGDFNDRVFLQVADHTSGKIYEAGTIGEDKDARRYATPVFAEYVNSLPAIVKTVDSYDLTVIDGVTSLTSNNRSLQTAYKAPASVDFAIGKAKYRYNGEYICSLTTQSGITITEDLVPCLGLKFLGATPYEAYLYSPETRQYYVFVGGSSLKKADMLERFRNIKNGYYDFVNQEVVLPCLATFLRLDKQVLDDSDETDNIIVTRLKDSELIGEVYPPIKTIFNTRSWFKTLSLPSGLVYQGPNRCIINRFVYSDYMKDQIKSNYGKWRKVHREDYHPFRTYAAEYKSVDKQIGRDVKVNGWTHNPFLLVTSPLGNSASEDCLFEWEITFCWPVEMDKLYDIDNYATVCVQAETMTPGGKVIAARPTHIYLTRELFTRTGDYGYYSFRYQSKCGAGNRERLHIWSDAYICVSDLQVEYKVITAKRSELLTQQVDIASMKEI